MLNLETPLGPSSPDPRNVQMRKRMGAPVVSRLRASAKVRETGKRTKLHGAVLPAHRRDPVWLAVSARSIHGRGNRILQCFDMTLLCRLRNTELNGSI